MTRIVNSYTIQPDELKYGDVMICTVTLHVMSDGTYRMYQCPYVDPDSEEPLLVRHSEDGVPQGSRIYDDADSHLARQLFVSVVHAGFEPDDG